MRVSKLPASQHLVGTETLAIDQPFTRSCTPGRRFAHVLGSGNSPTRLNPVPSHSHGTSQTCLSPVPSHSHCAPSAHQPRDYAKLPLSSKMLAMSQGAPSHPSCDSRVTFLQVHCGSASRLLACLPLWDLRVGFQPSQRERVFNPLCCSCLS